DPHHDFMRF
uniref:FMRFamide-14 n=1 Tax=Sarcophaga bullata TaxID=7385 RepID=FAR14_SARBU|nr:RecName: Full=FMRFamide-14; AltName: Full=SabFMRFamide-14 [Sarcophaga bullata]